MKRKITYRDYEDIIRMAPAIPYGTMWQPVKRSSGPGLLMGLFVIMALAGAALAVFAAYAG
jgi:hypothetical protein